MSTVSVIAATRLPAGAPPAATAKAAALDLQHLRRFTLGDATLEIEILGLFAGQAPTTIAGLAEARDEKAWRMAAHTLKGSARAVGAWRLAAAAEACERTAGWRDALAAQAVLDEVVAAFEEVEVAIAGLRTTR